MAGSRDAAEELISRGIKLRQLALLVAVPVRIDGEQVLLG